MAAAPLPRVEVVAQPELAEAPLAQWLSSGDVLLLKASRGVALERLIPHLPEVSQADLSAGASMQFNLKSRLQSLKLVSGLATFLKNPESLEGVFAVSRSLQNSTLSAHMFRHLLANPELAALVQENWRPGSIDLDALLAFPEGSLGHVYAHQLRAQGPVSYTHLTLPTILRV